GNVLIGQAAIGRRAEDPQNTLPAEIRPGAPALPTRAGRLAPADLTAILLDHLRRLADTAIHSDTRRVVLTAPLVADEAHRAELLRAAGQAGLAIEGILPAPVAAVFAFGIDKQRPQRVAVVDAGASRVDCAILDVGGGALPRLVGQASVAGIGGRAYDDRLTAWLGGGAVTALGFDPRSHPWVLDRLRTAAEQSKRQLAVHGQYGVQVEVPGLAMAPDGSTLDLRMVLDWNVFQLTCGDLVDRVAEPCVQALRAAGADAAGIAQLLLVGGCARLPPVQQRLGALFGREPRMDVAPDAAPALGAAIFASRGELATARVTNPYGAVSAPPADEQTAPHLRPQTRVGRVSTKKMFTAVMQAVQAPEVTFSAPRPTPPVAPAIIEVTATRLGLSTVAGFCDEIIPRDLPVPTSRTRVFSTGRDSQQSVTLSVCEGDSRRFAENRPLGTLVLADLPPRPRGQVRIAVTFTIDADGVLEAGALDEGTGRAQKIQIRLPPRA
ncbi:MAG TPA: Hsp70 family protein, partial [Kofleriaceae bacterium]|nr:Hsp70 family protein [Kofleriaceae bacterium]